MAAFAAVLYGDWTDDCIIHSGVARRRAGHSKAWAISVGNYFHYRDDVNLVITLVI